LARISSLGSIWSQEVRVMYVILLSIPNAAESGRLRRNALRLPPKIDAESLHPGGPA